MKNNTKIIIIIIVFLLGIILTNINSLASSATITVETARLREEATTDSRILEMISVGEKVEIIEKTGEWYQVEYNGITGYLRQDLLQVEGEENNSTVENQVNENNNAQNNETTPPTENTTTEENNQTANNNTVETNTQGQETGNQISTTENNAGERTLGEYQISQDTNIKILPLINAKNIGEVKKDENVEVTEIINDWVYIETENVNGWIRYDELNTQTVETSSNSSSEVTTQENTNTEQAPENTNTEQTQNNTTNTEQTPENTTNNTTTNQEEEEANTRNVGYVNVDTVNLRAEKSTTSTILANVTLNTEVEILAVEDGWHRVRVNGVEGYIASRYISDSQV